MFEVVKPELESLPSVNYYIRILVKGSFLGLIKKINLECHFIQIFKG
jgi:hypothetical protein